MDYTSEIQKVTDAISRSKLRWRTASGIAEETGIAAIQVASLLQDGEQFVRARGLSRSGEPLYTTREKYAAGATLRQRVIAAITNEVGE